MLDQSENKIVVIDDSDTGRIVMEEIISDLGCVPPPVIFDEARRALEWLTENNCALIVTDYRMPGLNGIDFTRELRQIPGHVHTHLIMVTAVKDRTVMHEALDSGVSSFMIKPLDVLECQTTIRSLMSLRRGPEDTVPRDRNSVAESLNELPAALTENEQALISLLAGLISDSQQRDGEPKFWQLTQLLAAKSGHFGDDDIAMLPFACSLYDIGKIKVGAELFAHGAVLSETQEAVKRLHAELGYSLLNKVDMPATRLAAKVSLYHQEHYDGLGYPSGIKGDDIPYAARLIALTATLHRLLMGGAGHTPVDIETALDEIEYQAGARFDPFYVDLLIEAMPAIIDLYGISSDQTPSFEVTVT